MSAVIQSGPVATAVSPLATGEPARAIAFDGAGPVPLARFLAQVRGLAAQLPPGPAVNLCEDRYRFLVAFCAVAARGHATLLPPSRAPEAVAEVLRRHPEAYCLGDGPPADARQVVLPACLPEADGPVPRVADDAVVAIGYTSGSTGTPQAHPKTWGSFRASTAQNLAALQPLLAGAPLRVVATVPPQHMYGMELSVLLPLLGDGAVHVARPLFPADVAAALHVSGTPCLLVTTPVHLRALLAADAALPPLAGIVSATAPLPQALAEAAEARFGCEVRELFGSTETCVIAQRRTAREEAWTAFPGVRLQPQPDGTAVHAAQLARAVVLADLVELLDAEPVRFRLCGRQADLLEIAGKRASLGDLTRQLQAVDGVHDAVVFQLEPGAGGVRRIAALVVAPDVDDASILRALRGRVDPVFLPRPLRRVAALPRNETGKLPRAELLRLLQCEKA